MEELAWLEAVYAGQAPEWFVVEGRYGVEALLESGLETGLVLLSEGQHAGFDTSASRPGVKVVRVERDRLSRAAGFAFHRGVLALARHPGPSRLEPEAGARGMIVVCPELADPGNLGSILRSAAALGADGVALPWGRGADPYSRKAIRASSGAVFRIPLFQSPELEEEVEQLRDEGWRTVGLALRPEAIPLERVASRERTLLVLGPEQGGLSDAWVARCEIVARIPMRAGVDSLNVAVCGAIALHALRVA